MSWLKHSLIEDWKYDFAEWYVIFEHGDMPWKLAKLLKPGIRHVWAVRWDGFNWISFNPRLGGTDVQVLPFGPQHKIQNVVNATNCSVIIHVNIRRDNTRIRNPWPTLCTCVEQTKALLGIGGLRTWHIYTANQLYKHLIKEHHGKKESSTSTTTS